MDASEWDARYATSERVWSAEPNQWVVEVCEGLTPGCALDLAAGEGRNAFWLVEQGWDVLATDFSPVAVERLQATAEEGLGDRLEKLTAQVHDATSPLLDQGTFDLVLISYLQLPTPDWELALRHAIDAAVPGGRIVIILHARRNLTEGYGGPQDPDVLHDPAGVLAAIAELPVEVERADLVTRVVAADPDPHRALDTVVLRRRATH